MTQLEPSEVSNVRRLNGEVEFRAFVNANYFKRRAAFFDQLQTWLHYVSAFAGTAAGALLFQASQSVLGPALGILLAALSVASLVVQPGARAAVHRECFARYSDVLRRLESTVGPTKADFAALLGDMRQFERQEPYMKRLPLYLAHNDYVERKFGARARPEAFYRLTPTQRVLAHIVDWKVGSVAPASEFATDDGLSRNFDFASQ